MVDTADYILRKGVQCQVDSYSAFELNGHLGWTPLTKHLSTLQINTVFIAGLALDFCVMHTALDARLRKLETYVILDASMATSPDKVLPTIAKLRAAGAHVIWSSQLSAIGLRKQYSKLITLVAIIPSTIVVIALTILLVRILRRPTAESTEDFTSFTEEDDYSSSKPILDGYTE